MIRLLLLSMLVAASLFGTSANVGFFQWNSTNTGVGWFTVGVTTNDPSYQLTDNIRLENVKMVLVMDTGGIFEYGLTLGSTTPATTPAAEPGNAYDGIPFGTASLFPQVVGSGLAYYSRIFDPSNAPGGLRSDRIVAAYLNYRVVGPAGPWNMNLFPGSTLFLPSNPNAFNIYWQQLNVGGLYNGQNLFVNLTVPGEVVPEPGTVALSFAGLATLGFFGYRRRAGRS